MSLTRLSSAVARCTPLLLLCQLLQTQPAEARELLQTGMLSSATLRQPKVQQNFDPLLRRCTPLSLDCLQAHQGPSLSHQDLRLLQHSTFTY